MILRHISVRNFRSYQQGTLDLGKGITALAGEIGAGKSSLLLGLEMALFGPAELDATQMIRHGESQAEVEVELEEDGKRISLRRTLTLKRSKGEVKGVDQKCSIAVDGQRASYSTTQMRERVIALLGFPDNANPRSSSDLWRWAVYVPQEAMRDVLTQGDEERLETIRKAHGLEEYRVARENVHDLNSELRTIQTRLEGEIAGLARTARNLDELVQTREEKVTEREAIRASAIEAARSLESAERTFAARQQLEKEMAGSGATLKGLRERLTALRNDLSARDKRIQELERDTVRSRARQQELEQELAGATVDETALQALEHTLTQTRSEAERLQKEWSDLRLTRQRAEGLAAQVTDTGTRLRKAKEEIARRKERLRRLQEELGPEPAPALEGQEPDQLRQRLKELQAAILQTSKEQALHRHSSKEIEDLIDSGTCPRCHQTVDPTTFSAHLEDAKKTERELSVRLQELESTQRTLESDLASSLTREKEGTARKGKIGMIENEGQEVDRALVQSEELSQALARLEHDRSVAEQGASALPALQASLDKVKEHVEREKAAIEDGKARLRKLQERRQQMTALVTTISGQEGERKRQEEERSRNAGDLEALEAQDRAEATKAQELTRRLGEFHDAESALEQARGKDRQARELLASVDRDVVHLDRDIEQANRDRAAQLQLQRRIARARDWSEWLKAFSDSTERIEHRLLQRIQEEFAVEFTRLFTRLVDDASAMAVIDESFRPKVLQSGYETSPEALSGGERTALALAYRIALGLTVRKAHRLHLDTLFLDEPSDGFSAGQISRLRELLRDLEHEQVVVVSHDENLTSTVDVTFRIEKHADGSMIRAS